MQSDDEPIIDPVIRKLKRLGQLATKDLAELSAITLHVETFHGFAN